MSFIKINEAFTCISCQKEVSVAEKTCRNHCPYCFSSRHVDGSIPGDRDTGCGGLMLPFEHGSKHGAQRLHFICLRCKKLHRNRVADDDRVENMLKYIEEYKIQTFMKL